MLNVFAKIYNKCNIKECVNASAQSKVQAVSVLEDCIIPGNYAIDFSIPRHDLHITVKGNILKPFAFIDLHGWNEIGMML